MKWGLAQLLWLSALGAAYGQTADPDRSIDWKIPRTSLREAIKAFADQAGSGIDMSELVPICAERVVGPLIGRMTPRQLVQELLPTTCATVEIQTHSNGHHTFRVISTHPSSKRHQYNIARDRLVLVLNAISKQSDGLLLGYLSTNSVEEDREVGPIEGMLGVEEALTMVLPDTLGFRWVEDDMVSVEPRPEHEHSARVDSNIPEYEAQIVTPPPSVAVLVTAQRLRPSDTLAPVEVFDRQRIEATGASNLADALRFATQIPYMRPRGYHASGSQFASLRGLGEAYTLVRINDRRAEGSAADLTVGAFDLNSVPLAAVERVEISPHAASVVDGTDAIGGSINIVLREATGLPEMRLRYGGADLGARERIASVASGISRERTRAGIVLELSETSELLGANRSRWRNQDFRRYGGTDHRSKSTAPANIRSLDGENLPGMQFPTAQVHFSSTGVTFNAGQGWFSPLANQAIQPTISRASFVATGATERGRTQLFAEAMLVRRETRFKLAAESVTDLVMPAEHTLNPFAIPLSIDAALTGLAPPTHNVRSQMTRVVAGLKGPLANWEYQTSLRHSAEDADLWMEHLIDPNTVADYVAMNRDLGLFTTAPGTGAPDEIYLPPTMAPYFSGGSQFTVMLHGPVKNLVHAVVGAEQRVEKVQFVGRSAERDVRSAFARFRVPLDTLELSLGSRWDDYGAHTSIIRSQFGLNWRPTSHLNLSATHAQSYHPPSLIDLYSPAVLIPSQIYDTLRDETTAVRIVTGGNRDLKPTTGHTTSIGMTHLSDGTGNSSISFWQIAMEQRVSSALAHTLLANESQALSGRVARADPTQDELIEGRPGRLVSIDISRANFGRTRTRGVDFRWERPFDTRFGSVIPRLDVTYTDLFRFSDVPIQRAPLIDRAGVASEFGTIPRWAGVLSLQVKRAPWTGNLLARLRSRYDDFSPAQGTRTGRTIKASALWDMNISWRVNPHLKLTLGGANLLDTAPAYSEVNGPTGFDSSQSDLTGRTAFIQLTGTL